jgi:hypothetical protein
MPFKLVSIMPSVANKLIMLSVIMLNVVILCVTEILVLCLSTREEHSSELHLNNRLPVIFKDKHASLFCLCQTYLLNRLPPDSKAVPLLLQILSFISLQFLSNPGRGVYTLKRLFTIFLNLKLRKPHKVI